MLLLNFVYFSKKEYYFVMTLVENRDNMITNFNFSVNGNSLTERRLFWSQNVLIHIPIYVLCILIKEIRKDSHLISKKTLTNILAHQTMAIVYAKYLLHNAHCTIIRSCFNIMELLLRKIVCVAKLGRALILACFLGQNIWNCLNSRRIFEHNNPLTKKLVSKGRRSRGRKNTSYFQHKKFLIG